MKDRLSDGSIVQDGLRLRKRSDMPERDLSFIPYPVKGQVTAVYFPDDMKNRDAEGIVCDVHVVSLGIDLFKVPFGLDKCGIDDYVHYSPVPATANVNYFPFSSKFLDPRTSNGDSVIVQFIDGDVHQPFIVKSLAHVQSGSSKGVSKDPRPGKAQGDCYKVRICGTNLFIDKDGNFSVDQTDVYEAIPMTKNRAKKYFFRLKNPLPTAGSQEILFEMDNTGSGIVTTKLVDTLGNKQTIVQDNSSNSIDISSEGSAGARKNQILMDNSGISIKANLGDLLLEGSNAKGKLSGGKIAFGNAGAELLDLFEKTLTRVSAILDHILAETHGTGVGPSSTPINSADFIADKADIEAIKTQEALIKGSL